MSTIDAFNDRLRGADQWVFAGGLAAASTSQLIDHQSNAGLITNQSLFSGAEHYSGFSLVELPTLKRRNSSRWKDPRPVIAGSS